MFYLLINEKLKKNTKSINLILEREFKQSISEKVLLTNIIYTFYEKGIITYLYIIKGLSTNEILAFSISEKPNFKSINDALNKAISITNNCPYRRTFHSDQGWTYQMKKSSKKLKDNKVFQSMSRKGTCLNNSHIENFFGIMKQKMCYSKVYRDFNELKLSIEEYIYYYNNKRIKEKLNWCSPVKYKIEYESKIE